MLIFGDSCLILFFIHFIFLNYLPFQKENLVFTDFIYPGHMKTP